MNEADIWIGAANWFLAGLNMSVAFNGRVIWFRKFNGFVSVTRFAVGLILIGKGIS